MKKFLLVLGCVILMSVSCTRHSSGSHLIVPIEEMVENYENNKSDIEEVIAYAESALEKYKGMQLITDGTSVSELYVYNFMWLGTKHPSAKDFDKLLHFIHISKETVDTLVTKLADANCRSLEMIKDGGSYIKVLYKADRKCGYYYRLYGQPLTQEEIDEILAESPICVPYSNRVFLEYNPYTRKGDPTFPGGEEYMQNHDIIFVE